jgi:hypothetical protein
MTNIALGVYAAVLFVLAVVPATQPNLSKAERRQSLFEILRSFVAAMNVVIAIMPEVGQDIATMLFPVTIVCVIGELVSLVGELRVSRQQESREYGSLPGVLLAHSLPFPAYAMGIVIGVEHIAPLL